MRDEAKDRAFQEMYHYATACDTAEDECWRWLQLAEFAQRRAKDNHLEAMQPAPRQA